MSTELYAPNIAKVRIAAPCNVGWENMQGDDKIRFCSQCELNVYNVSAMSEQESQKLFADKQGQMCLRFFRRDDGTIIFENCPVGLRKIRDGLKYTVRAASALLAMAMSFAASIAAPDKSADNGADKDVKRTKIWWTMVENGPTQRAPFRNMFARLPEPAQPLAQLGTPDRYAFFNLTKDYPQLGSDFSASDAFSSAMANVEQKKFTLAEFDFQTALKACEKPETDPMFREFVVSEYAKLLHQTGQQEKALKLLNENKAKSGMLAVTKISKSD